MWCCQCCCMCVVVVCWFGCFGVGVVILDFPVPLLPNPLLADPAPDGSGRLWPVLFRPHQYFFLCCVVCVVVFCCFGSCCVLLLVVWFVLGSLVWTSLRRTAQNFAPFFPSPAGNSILSSLSLWEVVFVETGTLSENGAGEGKKSAKFWAPHPSGPHPSCPICLGLGPTLWASHDTHQIQKWMGPPGLHTTARGLQTCTFDGPGASKHHQNSTRRPPRGEKKRAKCWAVQGKGGPTEGVRGRGPKNLEHTHHTHHTHNTHTTHKHQQAPTGTNRHQQAPTGTNRHQQAPTGTNRHQQAPTGTNRHQQAPTGTNRHQQHLKIWPKHKNTKIGQLRFGQMRSTL